MWPAITSKKQTPGVDWNVLLHFHEAKLSELATTPANCGRRKTDLGKSTLLFRLQRKGGTIGLPLIRNSRWLAARCWSVLQHRETLFSFLFFLFRRFPRLSRINGVEGGTGWEGKSAGCSLMLYSNRGPRLPRAFSPVN